MKIDYKWTVAKEGYIPIFVSIFITWLLTAFFGVSFLSIILFLILLLIIYFFRDPDRIMPHDEGLLCPADGKIITVDVSKEQEFFNKDMKRVCIFLSLFDCHINRAPDDLEIMETRYYPGEFFFANSDRVIENERLYIRFKTKKNEDIVMILYAGYVARRIVPYVKTGDKLKKGDRIGIIKFGSRVDIYVPTNFHTEFRTGDNVVAVETVLFKNEK